MPDYTYSGPPSGFTLPDKREVLLHPGKTYDLPAENKYVQALVAQKYLTLTKPAASQQKPSKAIKAPNDKEKV